MKRLCLSILLAASCLVSPALAGPREKIDALLSKLPKRAKVGILIKSLSDGRVIYQRGASAPLRPASNQKLITLAAALQELGPGYLHKTTLLGAGAIEGSQLLGPLVVVGGGDPNLSRRFMAKDATSREVPILAEWAQNIRRRGIRVIRGDVVCDDRFFDQIRYHPDWEAADRSHWYAAEIGALILNDGCVDLEILPKGEGGLVRTIPPTEYINVENKLVAASGPKKHVFSVTRRAGTNNVQVRGRLWPKARAGRTEITVKDPGLFFVTALKESLERAGVKLLGKPRRAKPTERFSGEVLALKASPLPLTVAVCGKRSLNHYAESLLKTLGREKAGAGSSSAGAKVVRSALQKLGVPLAGLIIRDGSGLSRKNRMTAAALAGLLEAMRRSPNDTIYRSSLATGGIDGTLRKRFRKLPPGVRIEAKTGTLRDTSSLSGYLFLSNRRDRAGDPIVFSMLMNNTPGARRLQEAILRILYSKAGG